MDIPLYFELNLQKGNHIAILSHLYCLYEINQNSMSCIKLEYACDVLVEHNLQVEIIFPLKQGGNIYLQGVEIAS
jgi:hypothetical protein